MSANQQKNAHLDFELIVQRIQDHKQGYEKVAGKDIVFFIGYTGAGKTTTILYLSGKEITNELATVVLEGVEIEDYILCCKDSVSEFVIGHKATSETTAVHTLDCPTSGLTYVDFAGQLDTNGAEIEIANTVGLYNTLTRVKSVRLVLVIDFNSVIAIRNQLFAKSLEYMNNFFPNLLEQFNCMSFLFTKQADMRKVKVELAKMKAGTEQEDLKSFLNLLISYVNKHSTEIAVEPLLSAKREALVDVIKASSPLDNTSSSFKFVIPNESRLLLVQRLAGVVSVVQNHLHTFEWTQIKQPLEDLQLLSNEISMMQEVVEAYGTAKAHVTKAARELVARLYSLLELRDYKGVDSHLSLLASASRIHVHINSDIVDTNIAYKDIRGRINSQMSSLATEIEDSESYAFVRQKLNLVQSISQHLQSHLNDGNKLLAAKLEANLHERVNKQQSSIIAFLELFNKSGNLFVPAHDQYVVDLLVHNLKQMSEVDELFKGCTHYHTATVALSTILMQHCTKFISELNNEPASPALALSFKVVHDTTKSQLLLPHTSNEAQLAASRAEKALLHQLDELNNSAGIHSINHNFVDAASIIARIHALVNIDFEFCAGFVTEKLEQTIVQMLMLVNNLIHEVQKKVAEELALATTDGCKYIAAKIAILEQAAKVERYFPDDKSSMVSQFLSYMHSAFLTKARQLMGVLEDALAMSKFGNSLQGVEISIMLDLGNIPEAVHQFTKWSFKFQEKVTLTDLQVKLNIQNAMYSALSDNFHFLEQLLLFNNSFMQSEKEVFDQIAHQITSLMNAITDKLKADWREHHTQFMELYKTLSPQSSAGLEQLKTSLVALISKLKEINDTSVAQHLSPLKPSQELAALAKNLQSKLTSLEGDTRAMVAAAHLDTAEKNLPVVDIVCTALGLLDVVEGMPFSTLSTAVREKRLNMAQQVPDKLRRNEFKKVAKILTDMRGASGELESKEFENTCGVITDHFADLARSVRCTNVESVYNSGSILQAFDRAVLLDEIVPEFAIAATLAKIYGKFKAFFDKSLKEYTQLLSDCRYLEALALASSLEELTAQYEELRELNGLGGKEEIENHIKGLPKAAETILNNCTWLNIHEIDKFNNSLEIVRNKININVDPILSEIHNLVLKTAKQKDANIGKLIAESKIDDASEELHSLTMLLDLKCLAAFKARDVIKKRNDDIASSRMAQFSASALKNNPTQLSEDLANIRRNSHSDFSEKMSTIEKLCNEQAEDIFSKLDSIATPNVVLPSLARNLENFNTIIKVFGANHTAFSSKFQSVLDERILPKLHGICMNLVATVNLDMRTRQWEKAGNTLNVMQGIGKELTKFVPKDFEEGTKAKLVELQSVASANEQSTKFLRKLDLFEPINNIELLISNLQRLKENSSGNTSDFLNFESYTEVVSSIVEDVQTKEQEAMKLYTGGKHEKVVVLLENLQLSPKLAKHDTIAKEFQDHYKSLTSWIYKNVAALEQQAAKFYKEEQLTQLEEVQKVYTHLHKQYATFREIFPSASNKIVDILIHTVSQQINIFCAKYPSTIPEIDDVIRVLVYLKTFSATISNTTLAAHVHSEINTVLNFLLSKKDFNFFQLGTDLRNSGSLGKEIVDGDNFPQFKAVVITLMNKLIARMTPEDALKQLAKRNKWGDIAHLETVYAQYNAHFEKLLQYYLMASPGDLDALIHKTRSQFARKDWKFIKEELLPESLAVIFVVWAVSTSKAFYRESKNMETVLRPHPIQVLTIMCMLGLDTPSDTGLLGLIAGVKDAIRPSTATDKIKGHLVQIGTGEGKSVILGMLSVILALLGCEVSCACYSSYLSERDYRAFLDIFCRFGVEKHIQYSTLAQLAGRYINEQGDIRQLTTQFLERNSKFGVLITPATRPRVLLIDEVDTFLSRDFYGATYNPSTILCNENVTAILEYIWKNQGCSLASVRELPEFKALSSKYNEIASIIEGAVQRMIFEVKNVNDPPYHCVKNPLGQTVIGYNENGTISSSIQHGYRTCFAYLQARDKGSITKEIALEHLGLTINCGQFSYAEIPKEYQCILGVTGTLETLCAFEKKVKNETYKISKETYTPSIYGDSRLTFRLAEDVFVMSDTANYHLQLIDSISKRQKAMQPVLVFFESERQMDAFSASKYCNSFAHNIVKESTENIDFYIRKATRINKASGLPEVTFLPRVFGRGLDFTCYDDKINAERGVHVIQAFLSEDISEEIQIKGRTARQGKHGSYCLVLNMEDLAKQFLITPAQVEEHKNKAKLYQFLDSTRNTQFEKKSEDRKGIIERSFQVHQESIKFRDYFKLKREHVSGEIVNFLRVQNPTMKRSSKIVCISDATGSMSSVWDNAKSQIVEMVTRIIAIGGKRKCQLMWVAYRDYSDKSRLECSAWSDNPLVLRNFINKIVCTGGGDYPEAVELGLEQANKLDDITRVILIGDAPPHFERKGTKLATHNITMHTDYHEQSAQLAAKKVPAYCFYMNEDADLVKSFKEIAATTGGKAALFSNANTLIDIVAENVLDDIGGDEMVLEYRKTYHS